jgi:peptidylprolyl isomerase
MKLFLLLIACLVLPCTPFSHSSPALRRETKLTDSSSQPDDPIASNSASQAERNPSRRKVLNYGGAALFSLVPEPAKAAKRSSSVLMVNPKKLTDDTTIKTGTVDTSPTVLSSERCLLQVLPVKNIVFRTLEDYVVSLSSLRSSSVDTDAKKNAQKTLQNAIEYLDKKRRSLEPIFNEEDSALFQIEKAERGERLIESFRNELSVLLALSKVERIDVLLTRQKSALLALSDIGELLVGPFPYDVPSEEKFSFLPRLQGRCCVTFTFKRNRDILGNVTILADGFAAPITAGNFVDLSVRGFYTGLPVKTVKKKFGGSSSGKPSFLPLESLGIEPDKEVNDPSSPSAVISLPILGSYREGFYDPLTAKPRRIPLEILRQDLSTGFSRLSYEGGFSGVSDSSVDTDQDSKPVLSFEIPGIVAFNHGDRTLGSSEFFVLPSDVGPEKRKLLNGEYSAFGYIIDGYDLCQSLKPGDFIETTKVGEFGQQNLVKIRGTSFSDVVQRDEETK